MFERPLGVKVIAEAALFGAGFGGEDMGLPKLRNDLFDIIAFDGIPEIAEEVRMAGVGLMLPYPFEDAFVLF